MTEQEKINAELRLKISLQDTRFSLTMQELREQREDIRRLNDKMDSLGKQINDTWRQTRRWRNDYYSRRIARCFVEVNQSTGKAAFKMTEQEQKVEKLEVRFSTLEQQFAATMAKVDSLAEEAKQQREDIRRLQDRQDADRKALEAKIDRLGDKIQNMVIAAVVGFGAIMFAAVSALKP